MSPNTRAPDPVAIRKLIADGLPDGPLARPDRFYQANRSGKLHKDSQCNRLHSGWSLVADIDLRTTASDRYCSTCVDGPKSAVHRAYIQHANKVIAVRNALIALRGVLFADRTGVAVTADGTPAPAQVVDLAVVLELGDVTWDRVSKAETLVRHLQAIHDDEYVSAEMLEWMAPVERAVRDQHARLRAAARASTGDGQLIRLCVLDLIGVPGYSSTGKNTPEDLTGPGTAENYPALCAYGADFGARYNITGYEGLAAAAWKTWRAEMRATDDLDGARAAVVSRTKIGTLEPRFQQQFHRGPARVPAPEGGTLWDWMVAEWHHQAMAELHSLLDFWEATYTDAMVQAKEQGEKIVALKGWTLDKRTNVNASTEVLAQLPVVFDPRHDSALVVAPAAVAQWLEVYDVRGTRVTGTYAHTKTVNVVCDAIDSDNEEMLATALRLWVPAPSGTNRRPSSEGLATLASAVQAAQGIHAGA